LFGVCRLERGQRVTGGKILYVNKRRRGQSSTKNSRLKCVHLLFDEDDNAVDAKTEGSTVTERVKSFLEAVNKDCTDQSTSVAPLSSAEAAEDSLGVVCNNEEQISSSCDNISNAVLDNSAEYCSSLTVDATDAVSTCQNNTEEDAVKSERCCDEMDEETGDSAVMVNSDCSVASVVASSDPDISKYWWQRYRLFSRFDRGIMIDRGW